MSIKENNTLNNVLREKCGFVYYGPRSITAHEADSSKANKNQSLKEEHLQTIFLRQQSWNKHWYVMPKYDGNSMCFCRGDWINKKGTYENLSLKRKNLEGGTRIFPKDMAQNEAQIRVYFNRLCALIWEEYVKALKIADSKRFTDDYIFKNTSRKDTFKASIEHLQDYDKMKDAKSPITLMCEIVCQNRSTEAFEAKNTRDKAINGILMSQASTDATATAQEQAFVSYLEQLKPDERYTNSKKL